MPTITYTPAELKALAASLQPYLTLSSTPPVVTPPVIIPPIVTLPGTTPPYYIFHNGMMVNAVRKPGAAVEYEEYDFGPDVASIQHEVPSLLAPGAGNVIRVNGDAGFQPRMLNDHFDPTPFAPNGYFLIRFKIKLPNTSIRFGVEGIGDTTIPNTSGPVNVIQYVVESPDANGILTAHVPLVAIGVLPPANPAPVPFYKAGLVGQTTDPAGNHGNIIEYFEISILAA